MGFWMNLDCSLGSVNICEKLDGDCPDDCLAAGFQGTENFNARFNVSPSLMNIKTERKAHQAETFIESQGNVTRLDNPWTSLHTTMYYFCCYTHEEKETITKALRNMVWEHFDISYDSFACNLDHDNITVYLHALPRDQTELFDFARNLESTVREQGIQIPSRQTLYHMTLARVGYDYPTDEVVQYFLDHESEWDFGTLTFDAFEMNGLMFRATS